MNKLLFKTGDNSAFPQGKPRVYLGCHPADASASLSRVCNALLAAADCAVYYAEDMAGSIPEEAELSRMELFVFPVSRRALTERNRALEEDYPYAKRKGLPVLPILLEPGLDTLCARRFGETEFVDIGSPSFDTLLKKRLDAVFAGREEGDNLDARDIVDIYRSLQGMTRRLDELQRDLDGSAAADADTEGKRGKAEEEAPRKTEAENRRANTPEAVAVQRAKALSDWDAGDRVGAKRVLQALCLQARETLGEQAPETRRTLEALRQLWRQEGDESLFTDEDAESAKIHRAAEDAIDLIEKAGGARKADPELLNAALDALAASGRLDIQCNEVERAISRLLLLIEPIMSETRPSDLNLHTAEALLTLADAYKALPSTKDCRFFAEAAMLLYRRLLGDSDPRTLAAERAYAQIKMSTKEPLELYKKHYDLARREKGDLHPDTVSAALTLARAYGAALAYEDAEALCSELYGKLAAEKGETHPDTILALELYAKSLDCKAEYNHGGSRAKREARRLKKKLAAFYGEKYA